MIRVECPNCGHENSPEAKFCSQCGHNLGITCPVCGTVAEPGAKFCSNCGASLELTDQVEAPRDDLTRYLPPELLAKMRSARAGHAMQGERRTVTMLFADIKGSTAAAEQFDPEDWAEIMNGAFQHLIAPIYRYEGTLAQLRGDAVLAFFGAPIAHEDDPVRALRAGLEMTEAIASYSTGAEQEWGIPIQVRVGINTGLVVVGEVGSDLRVEYTALGDAINVAARMEQTAEPGTVQVTAGTLALTGGRFDVDELGPVEVKGKSEPVQSYRVIRYRADKVGLEETPLVGRAEELAKLDELRSRLGTGAGWIASVIADAGVGKTRLLTEFRHRSIEAAEVVRRSDEEGELALLYGTSRSYDTGSPFSTVGDMLRRWWGATQSDADFERIIASVDGLGLEDPDLAAFLAHIAGVPLSEEAASFIDALETPVLHGRAAETFTSYLAAIAGRQPVVAVFEDLHWADDLSLALIEDALELTEEGQIGVLLAMRPYREEAAWRIHEVAERDHHHRYHQIELSPLGQEEGMELLRALLEESALPDRVRVRILERSDGNPLFIEEMARSIVEGEEPDDLTVPTSLAGMLTARLDRLDDEAKYIVQMASVLGSEFDRDMLAVLLPDVSLSGRLTELLRRGILTETTTPGTLSFRHALIQETAYGTILRRTRRALHQQVADHLIETQPGDSSGIARHLVEAGATSAAFPYLVDAGLQASRAMALADAIRLLQTAIDNVPSDADSELVEKAYNGLGQAYALVPDLTQSAAAYQQLYDYGQESERPEVRVAALNRLGFTTAYLAADLDGASAYLEDARKLAEEYGDDLGMAEYHMNACFVASLAGQPGTAVAHDEATVDYGEKTGVDAIRLSGLVRRATNYVALVDLEKAIPAIESALEEAEAAGLEEGLASVQTMGQALVSLIQGDLRRALELADGAQKTLERYGSYYAGQNQYNVGRIKHELGDLEGALSHHVDARRLAEKMGQPWVAGVAAAGMAHVYARAGMSDQIPELSAMAEGSLSGPLADFMASTIRSELGWVELIEGRPEQALEHCVRGLAASSMMQFFDRPGLLAAKALAQLTLGRVAEAQEALDEGRSFVEEKSFVLNEPLMGYVAGRLLIAQDRQEEADQELITAQQQAMDGGLLMLLLLILRARAEVAGARGDRAEVVAHMQAVAGVVDTVTASIADQTLKDSFTAKWLAPVASDVSG